MYNPDFNYNLDLIAIYSYKFINNIRAYFNYFEVLLFSIERSKSLSNENKTQLIANILKRFILRDRLKFETITDETTTDDTITDSFSYYRFEKYINYNYYLKLLLKYNYDNYLEYYDVFIKLIKKIKRNSKIDKTKKDKLIKKIFFDYLLTDKIKYEYPIEVIKGEKGKNFIISDNFKKVIKSLELEERIMFCQNIINYYKKINETMEEYEPYCGKRIKVHNLKLNEISHIKSLIKILIAFLEDIIEVTKNKIKYKHN